MIKKGLLGLAIALGLVLLTTGTAKASHTTDEGTYRHAYRPHTVSTGTQAGWMNARVDNFSTQAESRLVCVEAFNTADGHKTHLGCLKLDLAGYGSVDNWAAEFNAPTHWLRPGSYRVVYTYQGVDGKWYRVKSVFMTIQDGVYTR